MEKHVQHHKKLSCINHKHFVHAIGDGDAWYSIVNYSDASACRYGLTYIHLLILRIYIVQDLKLHFSSCYCQALFYCFACFKLYICMCVCVCVLNVIYIINYLVTYCIFVHVCLRTCVCTIIC